MENIEKTDYDNETDTSVTKKEYELKRKFISWSSLWYYVWKNNKLLNDRWITWDCTFNNTGHIRNMSRSYCETMFLRFLSIEKFEHIFFSHLTALDRPVFLLPLAIYADDVGQVSLLSRAGPSTSSPSFVWSPSSSCLCSSRWTSAYLFGSVPLQRFWSTFIMFIMCLRAQNAGSTALKPRSTVTYLRLLCSVPILGTLADYEGGLY